MFYTKISSLKESKSKVLPFYEKSQILGMSLKAIPSRNSGESLHKDVTLFIHEL
jgi:hypothetical protein